MTWDSMDDVTGDILTGPFMVVGLSSLVVVGWLVFEWLREWLRGRLKRQKAESEDER
ncbi:hypothetical protein LCGC14_1901070 [marine sediment metagenome]|uniref:Uncharacterized protein n=1 Tax=marine sediment metagenome TaxID=412755 RepID=A0A0F9IAI3_9ZZZZ